MVYLIEPKDLSARKPCPDKCKALGWCAIKPLYGVPPRIPS